MARYWCKCGHVMWNGETPNDIMYHAFSDRQADKILESDAIDTIDLFSKWKEYEAWVCPKCKRLYVFSYQDNQLLCAYEPFEME